jgi:uncharacterized protein YigE (DUF2233 family)
MMSLGPGPSYVCGYALAKKLLNYFILPLVFLLIQDVSHPIFAAPAIQWKEIQLGLSVAEIQDPVYSRIGSCTTVIVKVDARRYRFEAFQYAAQSLSGPLSVEEWAQETGALMVFNAGQYYENYKHMGLLVKNGTNIGTRLISQWKGLFVENPSQDSVAPVSLLDLDFDKADTSGGTYPFAVQSLMLFDREGTKRVRKSDWIANRTVVATDWEGAVYVFCTEGGYTLWEAAGFIRDLGLGLKHAMTLDGGYQSQLAINTPYFTSVTYGKWAIQGSMSIIPMPGFKMKLPAVIAVFRRKKIAP